MAKRPRPSKDLPDALREAVDRTVSATVDTRGRAQDAVDDLVRGAEAGVRGAEAGLSRRAGAVRGAMGERLPATQDDLKEMRAELRAIGRRLDAIEERLPSKRKPASKAKQGTKAGRAKRSARRVVAGRRVLITGVGSYIGAALARRLERDPAFEYVAGLDTRRPRAELENTDFIEADLRNPVIGKLIPQAEVDTVVHNQIVRRPGPGMSPRAMHDINVIGSLQLLGACEKSESIRTIVIRGSAGIYGSEPAAPQFYGEEMSRLYPVRTRFQRDVAEIENYFETFSRRRAEVTCTMLRYQPAIGPALDTQVTRYLGLPVVPTYFGFDPRVQLIHEEDGLEALVAAVLNPVRGAVNVACPGTIGVTKMVRLSGRPSLPIPSGAFDSATGIGQRLGLLDFSPDFRRLLRYGRAVDISRLTDEVGFTPRHTTVDAVEEWIETHAARRIVPSVRRAVAAL